MDKETVEENLDEVTETINDEGGEQPILDETPDDKEAQIRQLEIEKARLEGEVKGRSASAIPTVAPQQSFQQLKTMVWTDVNTLTDDQFFEKHKMEKFKATAAIAESESAKQRQELAETRVEARLAAKYGKEFYELKPEIDEMLLDASLEVRQDPVRLEKFLEKSFLASQKNKPVEQERKGGPVNRSRINGGFEKPVPRAGARQVESEEEKDLIAPELRGLARSFGITSEKERASLASSNYVDMDLGGGWRYSDPSRGFEKVESGK